MSNSVALAKCLHGRTGSAKTCNACMGSGWVKVVPGEDGKPTPCMHARTDSIKTCNACQGSGWAGLVHDE
jgi:hypothetical protein